MGPSQRQYSNDRVVRRKPAGQPRFFSLAEREGLTRRRLQRLALAGGFAVQTRSASLSNWGSLPDLPLVKENGAQSGPRFFSLAEREGFEPSISVLRPYSLSRGAPSTTRPPLQNYYRATGRDGLAAGYSGSPFGRLRRPKSLCDFVEPYIFPPRLYSLSRGAPSTTRPPIQNSYRAMCDFVEPDIPTAPILP